jgi:hypothetical protein
MRGEAAKINNSRTDGPALRMAESYGMKTGQPLRCRRIHWTVDARSPYNETYSACWDAARDAANHFKAHMVELTGNIGGARMTAILVYRQDYRQCA